MARFQRPAEGTWSEHYPELGTMVSYAVEVWKVPEVIHRGSARIDRILEPRP